MADAMARFVWFVLGLMESTVSDCSWGVRPLVLEIVGELLEELGVRLRPGLVAG